MQNRLHDTILAMRQWPEHHRKIFAFSASAAITLVIGVGWAVTLPGQYAALTSPAVPVSNQTAAASLSVVSSQSATSPAQNTSATQQLQKDVSEGGQFLGSIKNSFSGLFGGSNSSNPTSASAPSAAPAQNTVTIQDTTNVAPTPSNDPYNNLKYYVSNGVLITNPVSKTSSNASAK